jgi:hypothetical protein
MPAAAIWFSILLVASLFHTWDFRDGLARVVWFVLITATVLLLSGLSLYLETLQRIRDHAHAYAVAQFQDANQGRGSDAQPRTRRRRRTRR